MTVFAPLGDSVVVAVTEADQRVALPTLPASNPFIRLVAAQGNMLALYVKLGNGAVTGSLTTSMRVRPGSKAEPLYIFVGNGETHLSIFCEGPPGNVTITAGKLFDSDPAAGFAPLGDSIPIAVTQTDQRVALPTLPAANPIIRLVVKQANMAALYIKFGNAAVTGSLATSMRIVPGSVDEPIYIGVGAAETHLSIFCDGMPGTAVLTGGKASGGEAPAGSITYAQIQNVSASPRFLGRKTAGAGVIEEITLSEGLDFIGGAAQGDILYRGAATWARLAAGNSGEFLKTQGGGANPLWAAAAGFVLLTSGTVSAAATLDIVLSSYTGYRALKFVLESFIPATDDVELWMRLSTNAGSSYDATGYSRTGIIQRDNQGATAGPFGNNSISDTRINIAASAGAGESVSNTAAESGAHCEVTLYDQTVSQWPRVVASSTWFGATVTDTFTAIFGGSRETSQDTDAVRFQFESGNIASGKYAAYGLL